MAAMSPVLARRLHCQGIAVPACTDVADTVRHLLAVQAQDHYASLWAVGLRTQDANEADVERAVLQRRIVRSWPMRGTLHLVAAEDLRWMLQLLASRVSALDSKRIERDFGLDDRALGDCRETVARLLEGGRAMTRPALYQALHERGIDTAGPRGLHILGRLAHEGLLCQGPREGKQATFVLLEEWLPPQAPRERDEALAELARRYVTGHGPATVRDLAWWSGLTLRDAQRAWDLARKDFAVMQLAGHEYAFIEHGIAVDANPAGVFLLPPFDEYLVGYAVREAMIAPTDLRRVVGANGLFSATVIVEGRVVATWKRELGKQAVALSVTPLRPLTQTHQRAIARETKSYSRFLGQAVQLQP